MAQDPQVVARRSQLSADTLGEALNAFFDRLRWTTVVSMAVLLFGLVFFSEVPSAGFVTRQRILDHRLGELHEVGDPSGTLQGLIELAATTRHGQILPEVIAQLTHATPGGCQSLCIACHATVVPHQKAQLTMEVVDSS